MWELTLLDILRWDLSAAIAPDYLDYILPKIRLDGLGSTFVRKDEVKRRAETALVLAAPVGAWTSHTARPTADARQEAARDATPGFDHTHGAWDALLREHVSDTGLVDYRGLAKVRADLDRALPGLQRGRADHACR